MKNVLAIVPARGGSKGIRRKNLRLLAGKTLLQYPIDTAKASRYINKIVVSTEDAEIMNMAQILGAEIVERPLEMAQDQSLVIDSIRYTVEYLIDHHYKPDIILLLECTAPIRDIADVDRAIEIILEGKADSVVSFKKSEVSPGRLWKIHENQMIPYFEGTNAFLPRQKQPEAYQLTGQIYAFTHEIFEKEKNTISLLLGRVYPLITDSKTAVDIDDEIDLIIAEEILKN